MKDVAHLLLLRKRKLIMPEFDISHVRSGDDPLLWIPDVVLGAINASYKGVPKHYEKLKEFIVYRAASDGSTLNGERP